MSTSYYAAELQQRLSCRFAREDATAKGRRGLILGSEAVRQDAAFGTNPPVFLNAHVRPVKVQIAWPANNSVTEARRPAIYVPIWKAATSTVSQSILERWYNCTNPPYLVESWWGIPKRRCLGPHAHLPKAEGVVHYTDSRTERFYMGPHSASRDFEMARRAGAVFFTVVRHPLTRFVSGWMPRADLPTCERRADGSVTRAKLAPSKFVPSKTAHGKSVRSKLAWSSATPRASQRTDNGSTHQLVPCPEVLESLQAHAHNLSASLDHFDFQRVGWVHWLSQSYFLSATDAAGNTIPFDHVARVEDFASGMAEIGAVLGSSSSEARRSEHLKRSNSNHEGTVQLYADALTDTPAICQVCALFAQDFDCLNYTRPWRCRDLGVKEVPGSIRWRREQVKSGRLSEKDWTCGQLLTDQPSALQPRPTRCDGSPHRCKFVGTEQKRTRMAPPPAPALPPWPRPP